jgi:hypothetical protein
MLSPATKASAPFWAFVSPQWPEQIEPDSDLSPGPLFNRQVSLWPKIFMEWRNSIIAASADLSAFEKNQKLFTDRDSEKSCTRNIAII